MNLELNIQPTAITEITGAYGSIGYKRGNNHYIIDFYKNNQPIAFLNGTVYPLRCVPKTILDNITKCATNLSWEFKLL